MICIEIATDGSISDAFGNLATIKHLSTKDIPETINGLAYTTGLRENTVEHHLQQ